MAVSSPVLSADQPAVRPTVGVPTAPAAGPIRWLPAAVGALAAVVLLVVTAARYGPTRAGLLALGLGLGFALFHSRFGFTSAWRQLVAVGQGRALRAHALLLGAAATLFAPFLAAGVSPTGAKVDGAPGQLGISLVVGAILFGLGMQIGGSCASGTLFAVGSGQTAIVLTLAGFVLGSTVGARSLPWWQQLPHVEGISLASLPGGHLTGLLVTLAVLALIVAGTVVLGRRRNPPPIAPVPTDSGIRRVLRGSWPLWVGALVLAVFDLGVLLLSGKPWGVTSAFALWGSKIADATGIANPGGWSYWGGAKAASLHGSVLNDPTSLTDIGIIVGALIASALGGAFVLHKRIPGNVAIGAILGGVAMGYGARLAGGCNIGAYLGGISTQSLSGWAWGVLALVGTAIGLKGRALLRLGNPKPTDSVC